MNMTTRLIKLLSKRDQLAAQIQKLEARAAADARKNDTRRKILAGGFVLGQLKKNGLAAGELEICGARFVDTLTAARDRVLFNFEDPKNVE